MSEDRGPPGRPITGTCQHYERSMQAANREPWTPEMREAIACAFFMGAEAVVNLLNASRDDIRSPWHLWAALDGLQADIDEVIVNVGDPLNG